MYQRSLFDIGAKVKAFKFEARSRCVCGSPLAKIGVETNFVKSSWGEVSFSKCRECGSWCQTPSITRESLADWYSSEAYWGSNDLKGAAYANYEQDERVRLAEGEHRYFNQLSKLHNSSPLDILEVGCASGSLLSVLREKGHNVVGVDMSSTLVEQARDRYGLNLLEGDFLEFDWSDNLFDLVLLFGTISNLSHIPESFHKIRSMLKPGGILVFNFPFSNSIIASIYGKRFWMFTPSVKTILSRKGCINLLERVGFTEIEIRTDWQRPSFSKLFHHAKLPALQKIKLLNQNFTSLPFQVPIPGVALVTAKV